MDELEAIVMKSIREQTKDILKDSYELSPELLSSHEKRLAQIKSAVCTLYERYVIGEINAAEYKAEKAMLDTEHERVNNDQAVIEKDLTNQAVRDSFNQTASNALSSNELTTEIADALIDSVRVYPDSRIEIIWKMVIDDSALVSTMAFNRSNNCG